MRLIDNFIRNSYPDSLILPPRRMGNCFAVSRKEDRDRPQEQRKPTTLASTTTTKIQEQPANKPQDVKTKPVTDDSQILSDADHKKYLDLHRQEMFAGHDCNKRASEAWDAGDKAGAARIRDEGKAHYKKSDEYGRMVSISQALKAQKSATPSIDLHGYMLDAAMECVRLTFEYLNKERNPEATIFEVIPGAGTHSDPAKGAKIKPAVLQYFADNKIKYEGKCMIARLPHDNSVSSSSSYMSFVNVLSC